MKIILNGQALKIPLTGIGYYTYYLWEGLKKNEKISEIRCTTKIPNPLASLSRKQRVLQKILSIVRSVPGTYTAVKSIQEYAARRKMQQLAEQKFIYHQPNYILPSYPGLKIVTVHDLSHLHYPEFHPKERVKFLINYLEKSLINADHIITGSYYTRREVIDYFNLPQHKVTTIYHGMDAIFKPRSRQEILTTLIHYRLQDKKYILCVATLEPRKNIERLLEAFSGLSDSQRQRHPLVLVGCKGWRTAKIERLMTKLINKEQLYYLQYVSKEELAHLYSGAYVFAYLSFYEGFGLPVLEALASGVATMTSNTSSLVEVAGRAALLVDPYDTVLQTKTLVQLLEDQPLRAQLIERGLQQAAQFSWQRCVNETVDVYQAVSDST